MKERKLVVRTARGYVADHPDVLPQHAYAWADEEEARAVAERWGGTPGWLTWHDIGIGYRFMPLAEGSAP